jgi:hypothetical protein
MKKIEHEGVSHLCLFVAGCDIPAGTELVYYYGPTDENMHWRIDKVCERGIVGNTVVHVTVSRDLSSEHKIFYFAGCSSSVRD